MSLVSWMFATGLFWVEHFLRRGTRFFYCVFTAWNSGFYLLHSLGEIASYIPVKVLKILFPDLPQLRFLSWFFFHFHIMRCFIEFLLLILCVFTDFFKGLICFPFGTPIIIIKSILRSFSFASAMLAIFMDYCDRLLDSNRNIFCWLLLIML